MKNTITSFFVILLFIISIFISFVIFNKYTTSFSAIIENSFDNAINKDCSRRLTDPKVNYRASMVTKENPSKENGNKLLFITEKGEEAYPFTKSFPKEELMSSRNAIYQKALKDINKINPDTLNYLFEKELKRLNITANTAVTYMEKGKKSVAGGDSTLISAWYAHESLPHVVDLDSVITVKAYVPYSLRLLTSLSAPKEVKSLVLTTALLLIMLVYMIIKKLHSNKLRYNIPYIFSNPKEIPWKNSSKALAGRKEMLALPPVRSIVKLGNGDYQISHYLFKVKEMELWGYSGRKKLHNTIFFLLLLEFMRVPNHYLSREEINKIYRNKNDEAIYKSVSRFRTLFSEDPNIKVISRPEGGYLLKINL